MIEVSQDLPTGSNVSAGYRRFAMTVLLIISTLNFLDRQIISILAEPIKKDLHMADWHLGAMTGLAFALFYTILGIPIARYAETGNRPRIIGVAVALWSLVTIACGLRRISFNWSCTECLSVSVKRAARQLPTRSFLTTRHVSNVVRRLPSIRWEHR